MKKLSVFIFGLICLSSFGQEPLNHEKRVYVNPEGRIFINKALPVYLRLATSPEDNANSYLLRSEVTTKYSNPMYFDTEGYNTIRSPWIVDTVTKRPIYPQQDIIFEIYSDSRPPKTSVSFEGTKTYKKRGKIYIGANAQIVLKAYDAMSGVENIYYSLDKAAYTKYTEPLVIDQEKEYVLKYYSADNVGNAEKIAEIIIVLDKKNPKTSYIIDGDVHENVISSRSKIVLKSEDGEGIGVKNISYQLDDLPEKKYSSPIFGAYLSEGEHKISFFAEDNVGNTEPQNQYEFYVDKKPPTIVQEIIGKSFFAGGREYSSGRSRLKLTVFDNKAGVKETYYAINEGDYIKYEKPIMLTNVTGNLKVRAYSVDNVNNKTESVETGGKTSIPYVDLSGPNVKHGFNGPLFMMGDNIYINSKTKILLTASDPESGLNKIDYVVDDNDPVEYTEEFSISNEGLHKVKVTGYDNVENTSTKEFSIVVDNTGPEIYERYSILSNEKKTIDGKTIDIYPAHTVLFLSSTDDVVGYNKMYYSINNGPEKLYTSPIKNFKENIEINIKVRVLDKLGNEFTKEINFFIGE